MEQCKKFFRRDCASSSTDNALQNRHVFSHVSTSLLAGFLYRDAVPAPDKESLFPPEYDQSG